MKHKPIIHLGDLDFGVIDSSYHSNGRYSFSLNQMSHVNTCEILYNAKEMKIDLNVTNVIIRISKMQYLPFYALI